MSKCSTTSLQNHSRSFLTVDIAPVIYFIIRLSSVLNVHGDLLIVTSFTLDNDMASELYHLKLMVEAVPGGPIEQVK